MGKSAYGGTGGVDESGALVGLDGLETLLEGGIGHGSTDLEEVGPGVDLGELVGWTGGEAEGNTLSLVSISLKPSSGQ